MAFAIDATELVRRAGRLARRQVVVARRERLARAGRGDAELAGLTGAACAAAPVVAALATVALRLARVRHAAGGRVAQFACAAEAAGPAASVVAAELAV